MDVSRPFGRRLLAVFLPAAAFCFGIPNVGRTQPAIEVSPYFGLFIPTTSIAESADPIGSGNLVAKHDVAGFFGVRAVMWLGSYWGVECAAGFSPGRLIRQSRFSASSPPFTQSSEDASLLTLTARAVWRVVSGERTTLHLLAGPGLVSRGGTAYQIVDNTTALALALGVGLSTRVGSRVAIRWDVEDYVSRAELGWRDVGAQTQHDVVLSQSVAIRVGGL